MGGLDGDTLRWAVAVAVAAAVVEMPVAVLEGGTGLHLADQLEGSLDIHKGLVDTHSEWQGFVGSNGV